MKPLIKQIARKLLYPVILSLKADRLIAATSKHRMMILMYHGVTEKNYTSITPRHLTSIEFKKHLTYLKKTFDIIPLKQAFEFYRNGIIPKKNTIAITFDDGFVNNYTTALPLLESFKIPATFFISAICIDDENYILWSDLLDIIRAKTSEDFIELNNHKFYKKGAYVIYSPELAISGADYIKQLSPENRNSLLEDLKKKYNIQKLTNNIPSECYKLLNIEQLKKFAASSFVEIGSHGYSHLNLANIPLNVAENELKQSKQKLEEVIGKEVIAIAYPDGNYNDKIKEASLKSGYTNLLAVNYLLPTDIMDKNILSRFSISNTTTYEANMLLLNQRFNTLGF
jgi:peptidoglycan/xylan/chitin deacetylase (PgdA/CDA1 family)